MPVNDDEIAQLEIAVDRERRKHAHLTHDQHRLLALVDKAITALRTQRDRETTARFILTLVWQSRKRVSAATDFWGVIDREKDSMALEMLEKYFGGPHDAKHHPHRRTGDTPPPRNKH